MNQKENRTVVTVNCELCKKDKLVRYNKLTEQSDVNQLIKMGICGECGERMNVFRPSFPQTESDF